MQMLRCRTDAFPKFSRVSTNTAQSNRGQSEGTERTDQNIDKNGKLKIKATSGDQRSVRENKGEFQTNGERKRRKDISGTKQPKKGIIWSTNPRHFDTLFICHFSFVFPSFVSSYWFVLGVQRCAAVHFRLGDQRPAEAGQSVHGRDTAKCGWPTQSRILSLSLRLFRSHPSIGCFVPSKREKNQRVPSAEGPRWKAMAQ